jgi:hypothetical protein
MNFIEIFGLAFLALVVINLISMIWAIKKAPVNENPNVVIEQEV